MRQAEARGERRFVFMCGRRWGKTRFFVTDAFEFCLRNPGAVIPYAALTLESAKAFVIPEATRLIGFAPEDDKPEIVDGDVRFKNGSVLVIKGAETELAANRLRGGAAQRAYCDEAGFNPQLVYVIESVLSWTMTTTDGTLLIGSSPPLTPAHPFAKRYVSAAGLNGTLVRRKSADAPHIKPAVLAKMCEDMGGPLSIEWRREGECELLTDERRALCPEFSIKEHQLACAPPTDAGWPVPMHRDWYASSDLGFADGSASLLGWWDFLGDRLVIEDERIQSQPTSDVVHGSVAEMERLHVPEGQQVVSRVADAALITIADMSKLLPKTVEEPGRWRLAQKDDLHAAVNAVRVHVKQHKILVHPRCKVLRNHMEFGIWNKSRTAFERLKDGEESDDGLKHFDAFAALVYIDRSIQRTKNPFPAAGRPDHYGRWVPQNYGPDTRIKSGGGVKIR